MPRCSKYGIAVSWINRLCSGSSPDISSLNMTSQYTSSSSGSPCCKASNAVAILSFRNCNLKYVSCFSPIKSGRSAWTVRLISVLHFCLFLGVIILIGAGSQFLAAGTLIDQNCQPYKRDSRNRQQQPQRRIIAGLRNRQQRRGGAVGAAGAGVVFGVGCGVWFGVGVLSGVGVGVSSRASFITTV